MGSEERGVLAGDGSSGMGEVLLLEKAKLPMNLLVPFFTALLGECAGTGSAGNSMGYIAGIMGAVYPDFSSRVRLFDEMSMVDDFSNVDRPARILEEAAAWRARIFLRRQVPILQAAIPVPNNELFLE